MAIELRADRSSGTTKRLESRLGALLPLPDRSNVTSAETVPSRTTFATRAVDFDVPWFSPTPAVLDDSGWYGTITAAAADHRVQSIDVTATSLASPGSVMQSVRLAIAAGSLSLARTLAAEGSHHYPESAELQKAAHILAPPKVLSHKLPPDPGIAANVDWLRDHREQYQGRWVALRDGVLLKDAPSRGELMPGLGDLRAQRILVTKVY